MNNLTPFYQEVDRMLQCINQGNCINQNMIMGNNLTSNQNQTNPIYTTSSMVITIKKEVQSPGVTTFNSQVHQFSSQSTPAIIKSEPVINTSTVIKSEPVFNTPTAIKTEPVIVTPQFQYKSQSFTASIPTRTANPTINQILSNNTSTVLNPGVKTSTPQHNLPPFTAPTTQRTAIKTEPVICTPQFQYKSQSFTASIPTRTANPTVNQILSNNTSSVLNSGVKTSSPQYNLPPFTAPTTQRTMATSSQNYNKSSTKSVYPSQNYDDSSTELEPYQYQNYDDSLTEVEPYPNRRNYWQRVPPSWTRLLKQYIKTTVNEKDQMDSFELLLDNPSGQLKAYTLHQHLPPPYYEVFTRNGCFYAKLAIGTRIFQSHPRRAYSQDQAKRLAAISAVKKLSYETSYDTYHANKYKSIAYKPY